MTYKRIYVSEHISKEACNCLSKISEQIIRVGQNPYLPVPISTHADVQMLVIDDTLILTEELYDKLKITIPDNIIIAFSDKNHTDKYPGDVNLNALYIGKYIFANLNSLDETVKKVCSEKDISIINVKQGYAKCSCLGLGNDSVITADKGIADAARMHGFDVLLISPGDIELSGYDYGFIGGSSFYDYVNRCVYFFGDLKKHRDYNKIVDFCTGKNIEVKIFDSHPLTDIGGAVALI